MCKKGDFHIHSTFSDGSLSPKEIIKKASKKEIDILSITDHNSINGVREAIIEGKKKGIKVIPGVEVSSRFNSTRVHVLGYFKAEVGNENFFKALSYVKAHNNKAFDNILFNEFNIAFRRDHICVEKAISLLKHFNSTVILAHPVSIPRKDFYKIISLGFDGLEAKYWKNSEEDTDFFVNYAINNNMVYTAGSDFHRSNELYRVHGNLGDVFLDEKEIHNFLNCINKNSGLINIT